MVLRSLWGNGTQARQQPPDAGTPARERSVSSRIVQPKSPDFPALIVPRADRDNSTAAPLVSSSRSSVAPIISTPASQRHPTSSSQESAIIFTPPSSTSTSVSSSTSSTPSRPPVNLTVRKSPVNVISRAIGRSAQQREPEMVTKPAIPLVRRLGVRSGAMSSSHGGEQQQGHFELDPDAERVLRMRGDGVLRVVNFVGATRQGKSLLASVVSAALGDAHHFRTSQRLASCTENAWISRPVAVGDVDARVGDILARLQGRANVVLCDVEGFGDTRCAGETLASALQALAATTVLVTTCPADNSNVHRLFDVVQHSLDLMRKTGIDEHACRTGRQLLLAVRDVNGAALHDDDGETELRRYVRDIMVGSADDALSHKRQVIRDFFPDIRVVVLPNVPRLDASDAVRACARNHASPRTPPEFVSAVQQVADVLAGRPDPRGRQQQVKMFAMRGQEPRPLVGDTCVAVLRAVVQHLGDTERRIAGEQLRDAVSSTMAEQLADEHLRELKQVLDDASDTVQKLRSTTGTMSATETQLSAEQLAPDRLKVQVQQLQFEAMQRFEAAVRSLNPRAVEPQRQRFREISRGYCDGWLREHLEASFDQTARRTHELERENVELRAQVGAMSSRDEERRRDNEREDNDWSLGLPSVPQWLRRQLMQNASSLGVASALFFAWKVLPLFARRPAQPEYRYVPAPAPYMHHPQMAHAPPPPAPTPAPVAAPAPAPAPVQSLAAPPSPPPAPAPAPAPHSPFTFDSTMFARDGVVRQSAELGAIGSVAWAAIRLITRLPK
ncbi:MAG: hypothetical protein MHM6MM_000825 [Cercozoa sp. M6MM]